jgi:hypothetical protein
VGQDFIRHDAPMIGDSMSGDATQSSLSLVRAHRHRRIFHLDENLAID